MAILSLIIPVYNEENTLSQIVKKVLKLEYEPFALANNISLEIILVDDYSSDNSLEIAQNLAEINNKVKVVAHNKNLGKGAALKTGFEVASGDFIGIQDADEEYNPKDYLKMLEPLIENKADVVYGSRYLRKETKKVLAFWHTLVNKGLTLFSNMFTNLDLTDMETCYKLFKKDVIKKIAPYLRENRFGFEPEITSYIAKGKYRLWECAIDYNPRGYNEGKKIGAKDGLRALYCILRYNAYCAPCAMQFLIYLIIGGLSAIVNILAFLILAKFISSLFVNISIAFIISALVNYLLCIFFLFRHKARWSSKVEFITYLITLLIMGGLDYFVTKEFLLIGMNNFLSKSLSSLVGLFGNFLLRKYFVFPERNKQKRQ